MRTLTFKGLRGRLLILVLVSLLPALGLLLHTAYEQRRVAAQETLESVHRLTHLTSEHHERLIDSTRQLLVTLSLMQELRTNVTGCHRILEQILAEQPLYTNIGLVRPDGSTFCTGLTTDTHFDASIRDWFQETLSWRRFSGGYYQAGNQSQRPSIAFGLPAYDRDGQIEFLLFAALDLDSFKKLPVNAQMPEGSTVTLLDARGTVILHHPEPSPWVGQLIKDDPLVHNVLTRRQGVLRGSGLDGTERLYAFTPLVGTNRNAPIFLKLGIPIEAAVVKANPLLTRNVFALGLVVLLTALAIWFGSQWLVIARLSPLLRATQRIRAGDYTARSGSDYGRDELGRLAAEFDAMGEALQSHRNENLRTNEQLRHARDQAQEANRAKSEFLANISHEIRTPMGAILGFGDLLMEPTQDPETQFTYVQTIRRNAQHLLRIIDDLLDLSKVESGKWEAHKTRFSLLPELAVIDAMARRRADAKGLQFDFQFDGPLPSLITSDKVRLHQALSNLVDNALKFTSQGSVIVRVRIAENALGSPLLEFEVVDSGRGLRPEEVSRLFRPFSQADSSLSRRYGGTGLGLALTRRFAQALGGDVEIRWTEFGQGSSFVLRIDPGNLDSVEFQHPADLNLLLNSHADPMPPRQTLSGLRLLVIEDSPDNQILLQRLLTRAGAAIDIAEDGEKGVQKAMALKPDLILMDIQLPGLSGYEATSELRKQGFRSPIIALTAHAMPGERERCLNAGCNDYATKPVRIHELVPMIKRLTDPSGPHTLEPNVERSVGSIQG